MTSKRLGAILITCSVGMWVSVFGAFLWDAWWLVLAAGACAIAFVSVVAWAAQLE